MLIHECTECGVLSINRIAADDDSESIIRVFKESLLAGNPIRAKCEREEIMMSDTEEAEILYSQLHGQSKKIPEIVWI